MVTRRPVVPRPIVVGLLLAVVALVYLGIVAAGQTDEVTAASPGPAEQPALSTLAAQDAGGDRADEPRRPAAAADRSARDAAGGHEVFGDVDGLLLTVPHADPLSIAFHEASRPESLPIDPHGALEENDNATKYIAPADQDGPPYRILSSRGRSRPATSAVDIVVPDGARARSPVTGIVVEVRKYSLSGTLSDWRVVIEPDGRKDLHVVLIHLHEPRVAIGDRVTAGTSPIAVARRLPFASHVDYVLGESHPHVHLEVKPASAAPRLDPNAPAVLPESILQG